MRISFVIWMTATLSHVIFSQTFGVWSTLEIGTSIKAFWRSIFIDTFGSERAVIIIRTFTRSLTARIIRITNCSRLTITLERSTWVLANCSRSTWFVNCAMIDHSTTLGRFTSVTRLTRTDLSVSSSWTDSKVTARIMSQACYSTTMHVADLFFWAIFVSATFHLLTADLIVFRITKEASLTVTMSFVILCFTFGVTSALQQIAWFLTFRLSDIVIDAILVVLTIIVRHTSMFLHANVVWTVLIFRTTGIVSTSWLTKTFDTKLFTDTISSASTQSRANTTVTRRTDRTLIVGFAVLHWCTTEIWITSTTWLTGTHVTVI